MVYSLVAWLTHTGWFLSMIGTHLVLCVKSRLNQIRQRLHTYFRHFSWGYLHICLTWHYLTMTKNLLTKFPGSGMLIWIALKLELILYYVTVNHFWNFHPKPTAKVILTSHKHIHTQWHQRKRLQNNQLTDVKCCLKNNQTNTDLNLQWYVPCYEYPPESTMRCAVLRIPT